MTRPLPVITPSPYSDHHPCRHCLPLQFPHLSLHPQARHHLHIQSHPPHPCTQARKMSLPTQTRTPWHRRTTTTSTRMMPRHPPPNPIFVTTLAPLPYPASTPSTWGLKSNPNKVSAGHGYGGGITGMDLELVRKAEAIAWRWRMYSFSTVRQCWHVCSVPPTHMYAGHAAV